MTGISCNEYSVSRGITSSIGSQRNIQTIGILNYPDADYKKKSKNVSCIASNYVMRNISFQDSITDSSKEIKSTFYTTFIKQQTLSDMVRQGQFDLEFALGYGQKTERCEREGRGNHHTTQPLTVPALSPIHYIYTQSTLYSQ